MRGVDLKPLEEICPPPVRNACPPVPGVGRRASQREVGGGVTGLQIFINLFLGYSSVFKSLEHAISTVNDDGITGVKIKDVKFTETFIIYKAFNWKVNL